MSQVRVVLLYTPTLNLLEPGDLVRLQRREFRVVKRGTEMYPFPGGRDVWEYHVEPTDNLSMSGSSTTSGSMKATHRKASVDNE